MTYGNVSSCAAFWDDTVFSAEYVIMTTKIENLRDEEASIMNNDTCGVPVYGGF